MRFACLVVLGLALPLSADTVWLTSGGKFEGKVTEDSSGVHVQLHHGTITFKKEQVARIEPGPCVWDIYAEKAAKVAADDAAGHLDLAAWCKQNDLDEFVKKEYEATIAADPDNEVARKALGFIRHEGNWMTQLDAWKAMGWVERKKEWMPPKKARYLDVRDERLARQKKQQEAVDKGLDLIWKANERDRAKGKELLIAAGKEHGIRGLDDLAARLASYYEDAWREYIIDSADVTMEVRATQAKLKRLRLFDITPDARADDPSVPDTYIQLPEVEIMRVQTTVIVPVRIGLRVVIPPNGEERDLRGELGDDVLK
ncbi:MAG: hypothetical protein AAB434_07150 [Planctomycetota bacterium]